MNIAIPHPTVEETVVLNDIKNALAKLLEERSYRLVLLGSKARGDFDRNSDVDLAVIIDGLDWKLKDRIIDTIAVVELEHLFYVSTLIISTAEFQHLLARERRIALDIESEGVDL